jgi:hypothetical protein
MKAKRSLLSISSLLLFSCSVHGHVEESKNTLRDSITVKDKKYVNSLLGFGQLSTYTKAIGIKYFGGFQLKKNPNVRIGPSLFWERMEFNDNIKPPRNVTKAELFFITPGFSIEARLRPILNLQFGISALIGEETVERFVPLKGVTTTEVNIVGGAHLDQTLFVKTAERGGLKFGIGIFERFLSTTFYDEDFGGRLYLGFEF